MISSQLNQDPRSRPRYPHNVLRNGALACDVLTIYSGIAFRRSGTTLAPRTPSQCGIFPLPSSFPLPFLPLSLVLPPLLAGPAPIPMAGREMYASEGLSARSGLPARLSPPAPAKRNNPPERGVIEDKEGGYRGCRVYVLNDSRASKSVQS